MTYNLYYFSGTGNTKYLYEQIYHALLDSAEEVTLGSIEDTTPEKFDQTIERTIFIGYPIYGFGAPRVMESFIQRLPEGNGIKVVLAITAADNISINYHALYSMRKKLIQKGYQVIYERIFIMGANFLMANPMDLNALLCLAVEEKVDNMIDELSHCMTRQVTPGIVNKLTFPVIHACESNMGGPIYGKSLTVGDTCNLCGACIKGCPTQNIRVNKDKISFGLKCDLCMKCAYSCPKGAIRSRGFQFVILKEGYSIEKIKARSKELRERYFFDKSQLLNTFKISKHIKAYLENIKE